MKTQKLNSKISLMSLLLTTLVLSQSVVTKVHAQDFDELDELDSLSSDSLDMDDIDIDGKLSASDLLKKRRERLEERNRQMMEKKVEDIRVKQEIALTNKLQKAFNNSMNNLDENKSDTVNTVQAAPVVLPPPAPVIETRIIEVPAPAPIVEVKKTKIIPMLGTSTISADNLDLSSNLNLSIAAETMMTPQLSLGVAIGYSTMELTDTANSYINNGYGSYYGYGYYNVYGANRKIDSKKLTLEANAKFFFTENSRLKPYIGAGVGYNRNNLKYATSESYYYNNASFGGEEYSSNNFNATVRGGAEFDFTETVGVNLDVSFSKALGKSAGSNSNNYYTSPDQMRLENLAGEIQDANVIAVQGGIVVRF